MEIIDCIQGSTEWLKARLGIPTASRFGDIISPTGKPTTGKARRTYMLELFGERLTGRAEDHYVSAAMQRGVELEAAARAWYALDSGNAVSQIGFVLADGRRWGCSPDGITLTGGVEIKCMGLVNHLDTILTREVPDCYIAQVQGAMLVCQRKTWDFVAYTDADGVPSAWWTVNADAEYQAALAGALAKFCEELDGLERQVRQGGNDGPG
jgi:hypothetical protein